MFFSAQLPCFLLNCCPVCLLDCCLNIETCMACFINRFFLLLTVVSCMGFLVCNWLSNGLFLWSYQLSLVATGVIATLWLIVSIGGVNQAKLAEGSPLPSVYIEKCPSLNVRTYLPQWLENRITAMVKKIHKTANNTHVRSSLQAAIACMWSFVRVSSQIWAHCLTETEFAFWALNSWT